MPFPATTPAPTVDLPTGTYAGLQQITATSDTAGAVIYYTTAGTIPTGKSTVYTGPITVGSAETLTFIANSPTTTATYTIQ